MKEVFVIITLCFLIQYSSASIFDGLKEVMSSVEDNLGKLLGDVITDVKETIDCSILAMEKAINFSGIFPVPAENDKCREDTEQSVIPTDVRDEPLLVDTVTNATKQITGRINESLSIVNKSLHNIVDESEIDIELKSAKQVLVSESDRLFRIDDLLQDARENRTSHTDNSTSSSDLKSLQVMEIEKTRPKAPDVKIKVLDEVLDVLDIETVVVSTELELLVKGPETTTKLPGLRNRTKLLGPETITKPPDPKTTILHMGSNATTILQSPEPTLKFPDPKNTTKILGPETTTKVPGTESTIKLQAPKPTAKPSGPDITTKLPGPEITKKLSGPETTKLPGTETTTKLPGSETTTKLPGPEATTKFLRLTEIYPVSASTSRNNQSAVKIKTNIDDEKDNTNSSQTTVTNPPPKTFKEVATSIMYKQTTDVNSQTLLVTTSQTTPQETTTTETITETYKDLNFNSFFDLGPSNSESRKQAIEDAQNLIENSKYSETLMNKYLGEAEQGAVDIFGDSGF